MKHRAFSDIAKSVTSAPMKAVYGIIATKELKFTADSLSPIQLSTREVGEIRTHLYEQVKANYVADGTSFESVDEAVARFKKPLAEFVQDGFFNPYTGTGVRGIDPSMFDTAYTPVSMSPNEATSYYASGGIPQIIIDKKSRGALLNGYSFKASFMSEADRARLLEYAQAVGFDNAIVNGTRDGLIYGGAIAYPHLKKDNDNTMCYPLNQLVKERILDKDSIDYFVIADRWNCITVPNYDLTARDYLTPDTFFIPIGGIRLATARCAVIKPKKLPYWGALRNLGWGTSDYEGYIRALMSYNIVMATVPIMAQQMSLLVHEIPLDGVVAMNGTQSAKEFIAENNEALRNWSFTNPLTINSFGELKAINRTYTDFDKLIASLRQNVSANSGFPESVLFHTQPTGFSDNVEDVTLKQSETIKSVNNAVVPSLQPLVKMLVISCFGPDHEYAQKCDQVRLCFDTPTIVTNDEKGTLLEKFTQGISMLTSANIEVGDAMDIARSFIPDVNIPDDVMQRVRQTKKPKPELPPEFLNGNKDENKDGDEKGPQKDNRIEGDTQDGKAE